VLFEGDGVERASGARRLRLRLDTASGTAGAALLVEVVLRLLFSLVLYDLDARCKASRVVCADSGFEAFGLSKDPTPTVDVEVGATANCTGALALVGVEAFIVKNYVFYL
jgi:hypothetical protein